MLSEINWPASLKAIEDAAFEKCQSLKSIDFPTGLKSIGGDAFKGCSSLESVDLPVTLKELGGSAFQECKALNTIVLGTPAPPSVKGDTFKGTPATILIPKGSKKVYAADKSWSKIKGLQENK